MFSLILLRVDMLSVPIHNFCTYLLPKNLLSNKKKNKKKPNMLFQCHFETWIRKHHDVKPNRWLIWLALGTDCFHSCFHRTQVHSKGVQVFGGPGFDSWDWTRFANKHGKTVPNSGCKQTCVQKKKSSDVKLPKVLNYALLPVFWFET